MTELISSVAKRADEMHPMAAKVVAWCLIVCGLMMFSLILVNENSHGILAAFGAILLLIAGTIFFMIRRPSNVAVIQK